MSPEYMAELHKFLYLSNDSDEERLRTNVTTHLKYIPHGDNLQPFAETVNYNFMRWTLKRNAGAVHFTDEQMEWLRLIKDHIAVSLSIEPDDLDLNPFDRKGGLGRFYEVFGDSYEAILTEMNIELVAWL